MNLLTGVNQDFHRPQKAPGAYEWWHFDGIDDRTGYSFSIQFFAGNLFSAYYQDSLKTYWEKTKSPLIVTTTAVPCGRSAESIGLLRGHLPYFP